MANKRPDLDALKSPIADTLAEIANLEAAIAAKRQEAQPLIEALIEAAGARGPFNLDGIGLVEFRRPTGPGKKDSGYQAIPWVDRPVM